MDMNTGQEVFLLQFENTLFGPFPGQPPMVLIGMVSDNEFLIRAFDLELKQMKWTLKGATFMPRIYKGIAYYGGTDGNGPRSGPTNR